MRFYASFSLAFGLVAASPCKPVTSDSFNCCFCHLLFLCNRDLHTFAESATSTVETLATETPTGIESETTTAIDTTVTEASTLVGSTGVETTDVTISASETSSQATSDTTLFTSVTSADTTTAVSTDTTAAETSTATTTKAEPSTTAVTTTTTSEEPAPTDHLLIAGPWLAQGLPLKSTKTNGDYLSFGRSSSTWTVGRFVVDDTTGYLTRDGIPICAKYVYMDRSAALTPCSAEYYQYGTARLVCTRNPAAGTALQCSAVKLDCVASGPGDRQTCIVSTETGWTKFFISTGSDYSVFLGADDLAVSYRKPVDIFVDRAPTPAAPTAP
ncbi:uncharacterized protein FTJAE_12748 [Fusarium tjaetaba]|uniref:Uncharacterized protein n=1 Tax=Fusarium tjaetaba TaxID=1567544 RepID=A0A8H5QNZ9_9HYPO|nr:uncharacterized protein FTJAE_12748 [Fusarium tjaetaba]KAF5617226.1 hypothetical protein FTJAE_12748 [Fusarium tjaetaba]